MFWRRDYLRENATFTRNDTFREDLPDHGLLGGLLLRMSAAGVSGAFAESDKWRLIDFISKIEIIANGSEVVKSLTGQELAAIMAFDQGVANPDYWHSYATGTKWLHLLIPFGRELFDTEMGLDLSKFDSMEIKLTNDATSSELGEDISLSILQYFLEDAPAGQFKGYLRTEEWRTWTTVADETKYLEIPTLYKLRRIIGQFWPDEDANNIFKTGMTNLADDVELTLKTGTVRVFKGGIDDLMWENFWRHKHEWFSSPNYYMDADYGRRVGLGYVLSALGAAGSQSGAGAATIPTLEGRRTDGTQKPETYEADVLISGLCRGLAPENCVEIPFNDPDAPEHYLDVKANDTVKLDIHTRNSSSAADGTIRIVLDRYVPG